jgi:hypothetical protein
MTTVQAAINRTRRILRSGYRVQTDKLATSINASETTIELTYTGMGLNQGSMLCMGTERMYVWSWTEGSKVAVVERGFDGSTAATHTAGELVEVNARIDGFEIADALKLEINAWPQQMFRVDAVTLSYSTGKSWLELPVTDAYYVLEARAKPVTSQIAELLNAWARYPVVKARLINSQDTDWFSTGQAISLHSIVDYDQDVRVLLARPFDTAPFTSSTDLVTDCGLAASMLDIPPLGAAIRLMSYQEAGRTDRIHAGESRIAEETPPMYAVQLAEHWEKMRTVRLSDEISKLMARYPVRY